MQKLLLFILVSLTAQLVNAQIITDVSSLPDQGDVLEYQILEQISDEYLVSGEDVVWDFTGMYGDEQLFEEYLDASTGDDFDSFPEADLIIDFAGANAYAKRNTTNIEVIGLASGGIIPELEGIEAQDLSAPFVTRRAPIGFGDTYSGNTDISFTMPIDTASALGQLIGNFNPVPDSTIDSLRAVFNITRTEEVDSWGTAEFQNASVPALRLVQQDEITIGIELFVNTNILDTWLDISEFIDPEALGFGNTTTTNFIFLGETNKEHLLEVTVDNETEEVSGRYSTEFYVGIEELNQVSVQVYPNPTASIIEVSGVEVLELNVLSMSGQRVLQVLDSRSIDLGELEAGVYFLEGTTKRGEHFTKRIVKR